jgi:hypothetical protein
VERRIFALTSCDVIAEIERSLSDDAQEEFQVAALGGYDEDNF